MQRYEKKQLKTSVSLKKIKNHFVVPKKISNFAEVKYYPKFSK